MYYSNINAYGFIWMGWIRIVFKMQEQRHYRWTCENVSTEDVENMWSMSCKKKHCLEKD